jgi:hypothetical protein
VTDVSEVDSGVVRRDSEYPAITNGFLAKMDMKKIIRKEQARLRIN